MVQTYKTKNNSKDPRVLLVMLLVISLGLAIGYSHEGDEGIIHRVQSMVITASSPLQSVGLSLDSAVADASDAVENATASDDDLQALQEENESLRAQVAELEEYRQEAERLESLLEMNEQYNVSGVTACVIGRSTEAYDQAITVSAGSADGVDEGQSVMGPNGLVGQVISTTEHTATIRLLTDPQSGVAVLLQATREEGVVVGSLEGLLYLEDVDTTVTVQVGDVVVTSGLGGSYTRGLIVGTVVRVDQRQGEATQTIVVSPNEDAGPLQEVTIISSLDSEGAAA